MDIIIYLLKLILKAINKYTGEFILFVMVTRLVIMFMKTKVFVLFIYLCNSWKLEFILKVLMKKLRHHPVFAAADSLSLMDYLKYVANPHYREYMRHIIGGIVVDVANTITRNIEQSPQSMFWESKEEFIAELLKYTKRFNATHTNNVLRLAEAEVINSEFARKYLVWVEIAFESLEQRVHDLQYRSNNYFIYEGFLYIVNDMMKLFINKIPMVINSINGGIKKEIREKEKGNV